MRTKTEIDAEIAALKALKPIGQFKTRTTQSIESAIEELENGIDRTAEEWNELSENQRQAADDALAWKEGNSDEKVSEGWGPLVE